MYRILIVDDEPYIAEGLRASLREELDPELFDLEAAFSAAEALGKFARCDYNILVTDVKMPEMDGMALQERLRHICPDCRVIFLTGHGDFELIRQAMRKGGSDYLMKTEGDDQVLSAIMSARAELDRERQERNRRLREESLLTKARTLLARQALAQVLDRRFGEAKSSFAELAAYISLPDWERPLKVALLRANEPSLGGEAPDLELVLLMAEEALAGRAILFGARIAPGQALILAQLIESEPSGTKLLRGFLEAAQDSFLMEGRPPFSFAIAGGAYGFEALTDCALWLQDTLAERRGMVGVALADLLPPEPSPGQRNAKSRVQELLGAVDAHIETHVAEDLSLSALAEIAGLNPAYLSRLYLQERGMHLSERIAELRFGLSLRLLADGGRKIADIAREVGFWTPSHFIRFFKKRTGQTPQAYRENPPG